MLLAACAWMCAPADFQSVASVHAQIAFAPCGDSNDFACGHLTVPLDPTGATPGTITLAVRRHRAAVGEGRSAIIALAGGPGQPALIEACGDELGPRRAFYTTADTVADIEAIRQAGGYEKLVLIEAAGHAVGEGESEDFDTPLYYATSCEEQDFPWSRAVDPKARIAQATAAARALWASAFAPFTAKDALEERCRRCSLQSR